MNEDFRESKFNSAVQQILRLSNLFNLAHTYAQNEDWKFYEIILNRIWVELASDTPKEKLVERRRIISKINQMHALKTGFNENTMNVWEYPDVHRKVNRKNYLLRLALEEYEIFLRNNQNAQGLGKSYRNESEENID